MGSNLAGEVLKLGFKIILAAAFIVGIFVILGPAVLAVIAKWLYAHFTYR